MIYQGRLLDKFFPASNLMKVFTLLYDAFILSVSHTDRYILETVVKSKETKH